MAYRYPKLHSRHFDLGDAEREHQRSARAIAVVEDIIKSAVREKARNLIYFFPFI